MPLYYVHFYYDDITLDDEGAEHDDEHAALARAIKEARVLAAETVRNGHLTPDHRIEIVDADQNPVGTVRFGDAVEVRE